jgi:guanylate kinase
MITEQVAKAVAGYSASAKAKEIVRDVPTLLLVGVTGAGKDTILRQLLKTGDYHSLVSHTTRKPRANHGIMETNGVEYHFIDLEAAKHMLDRQAFVEAKFYSHNVYGTSVAEFQLAADEGKIAVNAIEVQGVAEFMAISKTTSPVFLVPPSYDVWIARLKNRYTDWWENHREDFEHRLQTAKKEFEHALETDYFIPVVNDDIEKVTTRIDALAHGDTLTPEEHEAAEKVIREILEHL